MNETDAPSTTTLLENVYEANHRTTLRGSLSELWTFREVVWAFGARRLRTRYKQAIFGFGWAIVQPLAFLAVFTVFLGDALDSGAGSYAAGSYASLVLWQFSSSATGSAASALLNESSMIRKVYFPREAPPIGAVGAYLPDLMINVVILLVIAPLLGGPVGWTWLLSVIPLVVVVIAVLAVGIPLAAITVYYRDVIYALPIGIQLWLFASPIAFPLDRLATRWHRPYSVLNPLVGPLDSFRRIFGEAAPPRWDLLALSATSSLVIMAFGYRILKALERRMADVV